MCGRPDRLFWIKARPNWVAEMAREKLHEGHFVQMLHVGPNAEEGDTLAQMPRFAENNGLSSHGLHHEIYLSDPCRPKDSKRSCDCRFVSPKSTFHWINPAIMGRGLADSCFHPI